MSEERIEHHGQQKHAYCEPCANYGLPECDSSLHNASVIGTLQAENAALRSDIERLRAFATGFCSRHAVPDATCDICNPVVHALRAEVERLLRYNARMVETLQNYDPNDPQGFLVLRDKALEADDA